MLLRLVLILYCRSRGSKRRYWNGRNESSILKWTIRQYGNIEMATSKWQHRNGLQYGIIKMAMWEWQYRSKGIEMVGGNTDNINSAISKWHYPIIGMVTSKWEFKQQYSTIEVCRGCCVRSSHHIDGSSFGQPSLSGVWTLYYSQDRYNTIRNNTWTIIMKVMPINQVPLALAMKCKRKRVVRWRMVLLPQSWSI